MLLCFFLGYFGAHHYAGKIIMIITLDCLGIWALIKLFMIVSAKSHMIYIINSNA
ncbi:TM2 domain-containing protein [Lysinibacillus sphaericus]|uniref:TM2 domain-containing protein n=1 Tax=Lysinibacillus sphaericus TaxID=1421 RepID=A0A544UD04_LYSSH|nr:TM2 domain-containing protein [Lysinibacillus sp. SDF0037]